MYITAVDWSGDGGMPRAAPPDRDLLAIAFASIHEDELDRLQRALADLWVRRRFRQGAIFKHTDSSDRVRMEFLEAIVGSGIQVRVQLVDKKRGWPQDLARLDSNQRLAGIVATAASNLPAHLIERGTLLLDLDQKKDGKLCTMAIGAINRATRTASRHSFRKVKCCPDSDSTFGEMVQVADMVAGAVRRSGSVRPTGNQHWDLVVTSW